MRKLQILGVALVAVFAFGVLVAASASAVTFLLAEWLVNGGAVTTELATESNGELELTDLKTLVGAATVLCSGILDGWVGPNSLDHVSEVLLLDKVTIVGSLPAGNAVTCTAQKGCETNSPPLLYPLNLPWESEVELMEDPAGTNFFVVLLFGTGGNPGWELTCLLLGVSITDECTPVNSGEALAELSLEGTTTLANFTEAFTVLAGAKLATCSQGGAESGEVNGGGAMTLNAPVGELTVSSDGLTS